MEEEICVFALSKLFMYEPRIPKLLVERLGSASRLFSLNPEEMTSIFGPYSRHTDALRRVNLDLEAAELENTLRSGCRYMIYSHAAFPPLLWECEDSPTGLFVRGSDTLENIFSSEKVAFVGSRDASSYGTQWCSTMVNSLAGAEESPCIVSGLAYGVDISAHLAAMDSGLPTIGVLGTGIDSIYPVRHEKYARRIMERERSAIISEYSPGSSVIGVNFLSRNRVIAGLSRATVLVESRIRGGGMTTARQAASYNRDVFALPGRNDDVRSQGCNFLIHERTADAIVSCDELFKSLGYKKKKGRKQGCRVGVGEYYRGSMDPRKIEMAEDIVRAVGKERGITTEQLARTLSIPIDRILTAVGVLEADGFIEVDMLQRCVIAKN